MFKYQDEPWLDPDQVLARYQDWRDPSQWPESSRVEKTKKVGRQTREILLRNLGDRSLCRTYSVEDAIREFLNDV